MRAIKGKKIFHFGIEVKKNISFWYRSQKYVNRFSEKVTQSDDELVISLKYITDRAF